jgi:hypothetical protein
VDSSKLSDQHNVERFFDVDALLWLGEVGRVIVAHVFGVCRWLSGVRRWLSGVRRWLVLLNSHLVNHIVMFVKLDPARNLPVEFADVTRPI